MSKTKIGVIGGGAAGFFSAIWASSADHEVHLFEKSSKLLAKVKISGGGRCNVTHRPLSISELVKNYPRGEKFLKKIFPKFSSKEVMDWFEKRGAALKIEDDGRVFPISDDSQTIIDVLLKESNKLGVIIHKRAGVSSIESIEEGYKLILDDRVELVDKLIVCAGGHPNKRGFEFLKNTEHEIVKPIPSLFTFNTPMKPIRELMGVSFPKGEVKLAGSKLSYEGPILVTHWGLSGPAVLKLSAFGAKWLYDKEYRAEALINWNAELQEEDYRRHLNDFKAKHPKKSLLKNTLFDIPNRFWVHLCEKSGIESSQLCHELSKKQLNRLVQNLFCYILPIHGKTTFKEEFVTSGGVALNGVDPGTMESKYHPNLFFAGEVLDIDGITGGFNFQSAWSTGYLAGVSARKA